MQKENRAIVLVLDGCGAGAAPDHAKFGDGPQVATVKNVWNAVGGFSAPNLTKTGFLSACGIPVDSVGRFGRLKELSEGKDSVTGHWEMMGIVTSVPFPTYPNGFPSDLVALFTEKTGLEVIGNKPASGTAIIEELGSLHMQTGNPILYTSADSVFQLACHEEIVPIERQYELCRIAREICIEPNNVQRVIARPFIGEPGNFQRTERRKDFPLEPAHNLIDVIQDVYGIGVVPELFDGRGFRPVKRTQSNPQHAEALWKALESDAKFIFANFEDFDMLYGHRNDAKGFAVCLEEFDFILGTLLDRLEPNDLLILTADHGNDPTDASTDHSREYVPVAIIGESVQPSTLGDVDGLTAIGATVASHLGMDWNIGQSLI
ncbi:phosphopentomutase [Kamptonema cortianum]|nr:phosphopentomutase [Geitlerinema splendidum]MDK3160911.1 phosphopentomutase [Kamptonema cortianum]